MKKNTSRNERVLTGIKPTGIPHVGNYVGAIKPALTRATQATESFFFIADIHALNQIQNPQEFNRLGYCVAATWLSSGLDPSKSYFYRQSDVPEIFELAAMLAAFTPKGWMNKGHAYKAAASTNKEIGNDPDSGINMGLFTYPILMAADILAFDADVVPVGLDQVQHVEIARDIALRINTQLNTEVFKLPRYELSATAKSIPGLDGRKMSKSYDNYIPAFSDESVWKRYIDQIPTDSSERYAPKNPNTSIVFQIYASLATPDQRSKLRSLLTNGEIGWGDSKRMLLELLLEELGPGAERFKKLMNQPEEIDKILRKGAERVRPMANVALNRLRAAIGRPGSCEPMF